MIKEGAVEEKWIPISSIDEIPKNGAYWVTLDYGHECRDIMYWVGHISRTVD